MKPSECVVRPTRPRRSDGSTRTHESIPIIPQVDVRLRMEDRTRLAALANRLLRDEPALNATAAFGPDISPGLTHAPALFYEDHTEIALFDVGDDVPLEYRALLLAGDDDVVLLGGRRHPAFERYCRDTLALGRPDILVAHAPRTRRPMPLVQRCLSDPSLMDRICDLCRRHGALDIVPYMGTGMAWMLASRIAQRTGNAVHVAAPPPRLTRRANDKIWFAQLVRQALNRESMMPSFSTFGPAAIAGRIKSLARRFPQVVVKVPDSAGSLGNVVLSAADITRWSTGFLQARIYDILHERGWRGTYPLMVGVWEASVLTSPSVNLWIPHATQGMPVIEGIFTQTLKGVEGEFVGAEPSALPADLQNRLAYEAQSLAYLFQCLGYFGRCGFDAVLVGPALDDADIRWIECNGRWGGVSTPVTLANRLTGRGQAAGLVIVQRSALQLPPRPFETVLELLRGRLLEASESPEGVVILLPGRFVDGSGMNFMVLGKDLAQAREMAADTITRLRQPAGATA